MKYRLNPFLVFSLASIITTNSWAVDRIKAANTDALTSPSSWVGGTVPGTTDIAVWDATLGAANSTVLGADLAVQGLRINLPGGSVTVGGTNNLTIGSSGVEVLATTTTTMNLALNTAITLSAPQTWTVASGRFATTTLPIEGANNAFTKNGLGTVVLTGAVTNVPSFTLTQGVLRGAPGVSLPDTASLLLQGGVFESTGPNFLRALGNGAGQVSIASGSSNGFSAVGTTVSVALGAETDVLSWGATHFNPGTLILNGSSGNQALTFLNPIDLNGATRTIEVRANNGIVPGVINGGTFGLNKTGAGTLTLNGQNAFSGILNATAGTVRAVDGIGLPTESPLLLNGAVFETFGIFSRSLGANPGQIRFAGGTSGVAANAGILDVNIGGDGQTLVWGDTHFNPTTFVFNNNASTVALNFNNGINLGDAFRAIDVRSAAGTTITTMNGVISGPGGFTINGSSSGTTTNAVFLLAAHNTLQGRLVVANTAGGGAGARTRIAFTEDLNLGPIPSAPFVDNISLVVGGVLQANESLTLHPNRYIGIGTASGSSATGNISAAAGKHFTIPGIVSNRTKNGNADITAGNVGSLAKIDAGTLFLNQDANTYSGSTAIFGGTLEVTKLSNGSLPSSIGNSTAIATNLAFSGGRLQYVGNGDTTDRLFTVTASSAIESSGNAPLVFSSTGANVVTGAGATRTLTLSGTNTGANKISSSFSNGTPVATTGTWADGATQITVASATGLANGMIITGPGIRPNTTITGINTTARLLNVSLAITTAATDAPIQFATGLAITKSGSGNWTLSGNNTNTGLTRLNGGGSLIFDYSEGANHDPLASNSVTNFAGTLVLKGRTTGITSDTIPLYQLGDNQFARASLILDKGAGDGFGLTIGTLQGNTTTQRHDLIDISNSPANSVTVSALGTNIGVVESVILSAVTSTATGRANLILRDATGYGFPTLSNGTSGLIQKVPTTAIAPGTDLTFDLPTGNLFFGPGSYATSGNSTYHTANFDSTEGPIDLSIGAGLKLNGGASGRAMLFSGDNEITLNGPANASNTPTWFHNFLDPNSTLHLNFGLGTSQTFMIGGSGFTIYTGAGFGNSFMLNGGTTRIAPVSAIDISASATPIRINSGGVFEIGADLNGEIPGDLTKTIGDVGGNMRLIGDAGFSAYTDEAGGTRIVDFVTLEGARQSLVWGSSLFLSYIDGTDGDFNLKLSSPRSNANIEIKNPISLNNRNRVIEVANGGNIVDATLSGQLSGPGVGFTKTGAGLLSLTGSNSYTGETHIREGVLRVNGTSFAAASKLRIDAGAYLDVSGDVYVSSAIINGEFQQNGPVVSDFVTGTGRLIVGASAALLPYDQWVLDNTIPDNIDEPGQDADSDGLLNLLEYAVGSPPKDPSGSVLTKTADAIPTIQFNRSSTKTDITILIQSSTTLAPESWTTIARSTLGGIVTADVANVSVIDPNNATGQSAVNVTDNRNPGTTNFYRLRIQK